MSRGKRHSRHHYSYVKFGGFILAVHHSIWFLVALVCVGLGLWEDHANPGLFMVILFAVIAVMAIILISMLVVLVQMFRTGRLNPSVVFRGGYEPEPEPEIEDTIPLRRVV